MSNVKEEIKAALDYRGYTVNDISYVICKDKDGDKHNVDALSFIEAADISYDYDNAYVDYEISIVLKDGNFFRWNSETDALNFIEVPPKVVKNTEKYNDNMVMIHSFDINMDDLRKEIFG